MPLIAIAVVLIIMSLTPSLAFVLGILLIGVHLGRRSKPLKTTYTVRRDAGTLQDTIRYIEENRND